MFDTFQAIKVNQTLIKKGLGLNTQIQPKRKLLME